MLKLLNLINLIEPKHAAGLAFSVAGSGTSLILVTLPYVQITAGLLSIVLTTLTIRSLIKKEKGK